MPADDEQHVHRRFFIGPMPDKLIFQQKTRSKPKRGWFSNSASASASGSHDADDDESISLIIKEHAFNFFIRHGGNVEDWGDKTEQSVRKEMLQRWRESEWATLWQRHRRGGGDNQEQQRPMGQWVGSSFEIGNFLGVNIFTDEPADSLRERLSTHTASTSGRLKGATSEHAASPAAVETFVSARSHRSPGYAQLSSTADLPPDPGSETSITGLLRPPASPASKPQTEVTQRPIFKSSSFAGVKSDGHIGFVLPPSPAKSKGKRKSMRYSESFSSSHSGATDVPSVPPPAAPHEVLQRTGTAIQDTSAGDTAEETEPQQPELQWGDVVMRDRMLIRVCRTNSDNIGPFFDEAQHRTAGNMRYEDWAEFMVVWRKDRLEIYEDYFIPCKEWFTHHKHLVFTIPLKPLHTRLSLYSFIDLTFCITSPRPRTRDGTDLFILKVKSRTRAVDWVWNLWRQLGGRLPSYIEVRSSNLDARIKVDIPASTTVPVTSSPSDPSISPQPDSLLSRANILALCIHVFRRSSRPDWRELAEREESDLALAWRVGGVLDWVSWDDDVCGHPRGWAVVSGLALKKPGMPLHLELRVKSHSNSIMHTQMSKKLAEPPAIEGYLYRIKPWTQSKRAVYLATHDGNLFLLAPGNAHPPAPLGASPAIIKGSGVDGDLTTRMKEEEVKRGAQQVADAAGVADLRSILVVRRAFGVIAGDQYDQKDVPANGTGDEYEAWGEEVRSTDDGEDEGGDEGLAKRSSGERPHLRMRRSFELLLVSGHVIRFETHSCKTALEWIDRLRALVIYWRIRHRTDAHDEMDLAQIDRHRPRLTPHMHARPQRHSINGSPDTDNKSRHRHADESHLPPEAPTDPDAPFPALGRLYNYCVLDGCKPILKGGKVFTRKGLHGQYKLVELFLIAGHLVQYHVTPDSSLYHKRSHTIYLLDAYVCSGYFAALSLPKGQFDPNTANVARRYHDGLEADDPDEDVLFIIWYSPRTIDFGGSKGESKRANDGTSISTSLPSLSEKRKMLIFRTRSKLERDAWCWALNCEIEKIVRMNKDREQKMRQTGGLVMLK